MIKLIASDMDGTLLDENSNVPPETYGLIHELREHGIVFCVSSGRSYKFLRQAFEPVADEIDYVAANGAEIYVDGKLIDLEVFSHDAIMRLGEVVNQFDSLHLIALSQSVTYCFDPPQRYPKLLEIYEPETPLMLDVEPSPEVDVNNVTVICEDISTVPDIVYALGAEMGEEWIFAWSGGLGIDVIPRGVTKSFGIRKVIRHRLFSPDEVMVYGDSMNDYDILRYVGHPIVMGNGLYGVKQIAERIIETNVEHGVQKDIRRLLDSLDGA